MRRFRVSSYSIRVTTLASLLSVTLALAACGKEAATPAPTAPAAAPTRTLPPANPPSTPGPGEVTVGQLADRIAAAWPSVAAYRTTFTTQALTASASPVASPVAVPAILTVDEIALPDRRHRLQTSGETVVTEIIVIGTAIYARGASVPVATPVNDPTTWTAIDPAAFPADSMFRGFYDDLLLPIGPPYAGLSAAERERIARPAGQVTVGGRTCDAFRTVDLTLSGERVEIVIALEAGGLPCSIETRIAGTVNLTTFEFDPAIEVSAPI